MATCVRHENLRISLRKSGPVAYEILMMGSISAVDEIKERLIKSNPYHQLHDNLDDNYSIEIKTSKFTVNMHYEEAERVVMVVLNIAGEFGFAMVSSVFHEEISISMLSKVKER